MSLRRFGHAARQGTRDPTTRAITVYLVASPTCSLLTTWVGAQSEYRFPHPILTTTLHLAISLITLIVVSLLAKALLRTSFPGTPSARQLTAAPASSSRRIVGSLLASVASHAPTGRVTTRLVSESLTPYIISASMAAVLSSLLESRSSRIASPQFTSFTHLLPLPLIVLIPFLIPDLSATVAGNRIVALLVWLVLVTGPGVGWEATGEGWVCAGLAAVAVMGWVVAIKVGMDEHEIAKEEGDPHPPSFPTPLLYLILTTSFLVPPLVFSHELSQAASSGHFGFFTEVGFWLQESIMSWLGLVSLLAFWALIRETSPLTLFVIVSTKDFTLPFLYSFVFSNPVEDTKPLLLRPGQQLLALVAIIFYWFVDEGAVAGAESVDVKSH